MTITTVFTITYWLIAFMASALFGWKAVEIFTDVPKKPKEEQPPSSWWWQQRWLNFLGSLVGWIALWVLVRRYLACVFGECPVEPTHWDVWAAFVAFVGVTGYLPLTVVGLISGVSGLSSKVGDVIKGLLPSPPGKGSG